MFKSSIICFVRLLDYSFPGRSKGVIIHLIHIADSSGNSSGLFQTTSSNFQPLRSSIIVFAVWRPSLLGYCRRGIPQLWPVLGFDKCNEIESVFKSIVQYTVCILGCISFCEIAIAYIRSFPVDTPFTGIITVNGNIMTYCSLQWSCGHINVTSLFLPSNHEVKNHDIVPWLLCSVVIIFSKRKKNRLRENSKAFSKNISHICTWYGCYQVSARMFFSARFQKECIYRVKHVSC